MRNLLERSIWTGIETGTALVAVSDLIGLEATPQQSLAVAGAAAVLAALKVFSTGRLAVLRSKE
jgi:hypothetical protein